MQKGGFEFEPSFFYRLVSKFILIQPLFVTIKVKKLKSERGAGRKEMFTEEQKARVKMLRLQGKSYRAIAKDMNCSVATVHKMGSIVKMLLTCEIRIFPARPR